MKKIFIIILSLLSFATFAQKPFKIHNSDIRFKWASDSIRFDITGKKFYLFDTIVFSDGGKMWGTDSAGVTYPNYWKLTGNMLEPKTATNYVNSPTSYYLKGVNILSYDTTVKSISIGENSLLSNTGVGNTSVGWTSLMSNTTGNSNTSIGGGALQSNISGNKNTAIGLSALGGNTIDSNNIAVGHLSGVNSQMSNRLWIGAGDSTKSIIYGEMLTRPRIRINGDLNIKGKISNGGLYSRDTLVTLADSSTSFNFPAGTGHAQIYVDSIGIIVSFANIYYSNNGVPYLISNGSNFVITNTDARHTLTDAGTNIVLTNRRSTSYSYLISYIYH